MRPPLPIRVLITSVLAGCTSASEPGSTTKQGTASTDSSTAPTETGAAPDSGTTDDTADPEDPDPEAPPELEVTPTGSWCSAPAPALAPTDIAADWGLVDTSDGIESRKEAGPVAALDLDGDGLDELIVGHRSRGLILHRNTGGAFDQHTLLDARDLTGIALADIDGDGDLDLWTGGYHGRMWLLRNDGPGDGGWLFTDITAGSGLDTVPNRPQKTDATFGDFDGDGDLDLYVNRAAAPGSTDEATLDQLFESQGDGTFTAVSSRLTTDQRQGVSWSAVWSDLDGDDDPDLFVANADQASAGPSLMVENIGATTDGWEFTDRSADCFCTDNFNPMGVSAGDVDHDGDIDLYLTNTAADQLLLNDGDLTFVDVSRTFGDLDLPTTRHMTFGSVWSDVDNDGWQDVFVSAGPLSERPDPALDMQPDRLLLNQGGTALLDHATALGVDSTGIGRGVTRALLDDDGYPELVVINLDGPSHIWRSPCLANRALVVSLRQSTANSRGVGARVTLAFEDGPSQVQEVHTKPGWAGAMEPRAWFGLADQSPTTLTVRWPDGEETVWSVPADADGRVLVER